MKKSATFESSLVPKEIAVAFAETSGVSPSIRGGFERTIAASANYLLAPLLIVALFASTSAGQSSPTPSAATGYSIGTFFTMPLGTNGFSELGKSPVAVAFDAQGRLFVLSLDGAIRVIEDLDHNGVGETVTLFFDGSLTFNYPATGLGIQNGEVFVAHRGAVSKLIDANADLVPESVAQIIGGLPSGMHQNNGFAFDQNGKVYFGVGSQNDHDVPTNPYSATIMRADLDGQNLEVFATGMRNAYGLAFKPGFGLVCTENAWNSVYTDPSFDEINLVEIGRDYGFPIQTGPAPIGSPIKSPVATLPPHSAPCGIDFDFSGAWSGFQNDMYVSLVAAGAGAVIRVSTFEDPITGAWKAQYFPVAEGFTAAIDSKFSPAGDLFVADFQTQKIYRIRPDDAAKVRITNGPQLGGTMLVTAQASGHPNEYLVIALSTSITAPFTLPDGRIFPLDINDIAFVYTTTPGNDVCLFPVPDFTDAAGVCQGAFVMPYIPFLDGFTLYTAFLTISPSAVIGAVSPAFPFRLFL